MKVLCKRTYIERIKYEYGNDIRWCKDKYYQFFEPNEYELENGIFGFIEIEKNYKTKEIYTVRIIKKEFEKYFINQEEIRDSKINQIINKNNE
jgi:hypothetical protein